VPLVVVALRLACLTAGLALLALLCWVLFAASMAALQARRRQRALLTLLAHGDPKVPGALVVDYPSAAAYCLPGLRSRSRIVVSVGALELLGRGELAAVLAHERAHLRERHDLVLLPFTALLRAFRWCAVAREAHAAVALLVEMLAPYKGRVFDPCCGSGGMFVQSEKFVEAHGGRVGDISIFGQESNTTTWRLAKMNLAIRGIDADLGEPDSAGSFFKDQHPDLKNRASKAGAEAAILSRIRKSASGDAGKSHRDPAQRA